MFGGKVASEDEADFGPTLDALWTLAQKNSEPAPASLMVAGVLVPAPPGARHQTRIGGMGPEHPFHYLRRGHSVLAFDSRGIGDEWIAPEDAADFQPTVDVLWELARNRAVSSPPFVTIRGVAVPVPAGAEYRAAYPSDPIHLIKRANSFVSFDEGGVKLAEIAPRDQADFQPTLDALQKLFSGP